MAASNACVSDSLSILTTEDACHIVNLQVRMGNYNGITCTDIRHASSALAIFQQ